MRHLIGKVQDFPENRLTVVEVDGRQVGIYNHHGVLHAVLNSCPHQMGPICLGTVGGTMLPSEPGTLEYGLEGRILRCPWHGWEFDIVTGKAVFNITRRKLLKYPVVVEQDLVFIEMR